MYAGRSQWDPLAALWRGRYGLGIRYVLLCFPAPIFAATAFVLLDVSIVWGPEHTVAPMTQPRRLHDHTTAQAAFGTAAVLLGIVTLGLLALTMRSAPIPEGEGRPGMTALTWFVRLATLFWWLFLMLAGYAVVTFHPLLASAPIGFEPPAHTGLFERDLADSEITLPPVHEIILYEYWTTGASARDYVIRVDSVGEWVSASRPLGHDWAPGPPSFMTLSAMIHWICAQQITGFPTLGLDTDDRRLAARAVCDHLKPAPLRQGFRHLTVHRPRLDDQSVGRPDDRDLMRWGDKAVIAFPDLSLVWVHEGWH